MGNRNGKRKIGNGKMGNGKIGNKLPIKGTRNPLGAQSVASLDASNSPDEWRGWNGAGQSRAGVGTGEAISHKRAL